jgi:spermidine synthase
VPPSVQKIDVLELEPKVIDANRAVAAMRKHNPLIDPRLNIVINDARSALRLTSRRYDAIVSQPSHPWTAGASHLYTREFMSLAHDHLTPGGVFVQWMNVSFLDEELMRSLTATLLDVFRELRVYRPDPDTLVFLASDTPLNLEQQLAETGAPLNAAPLHFARFGINNLEDLVTALMLDTSGARQLSSGAQLITDDDNRIATSNVFERRRGMTRVSLGSFLAAVDPLQREDSLVYQTLRNQLSFPYIVRRAGVFALGDPSVADRVRRITQLLGKGPEAEYTGAYFYGMVRQPQRQNEMLRIGIEEYPNDDNLRLEFLRDSFGDLARDAATPDIAEVAASLKGLPAGILAAARHAAKGEWADVAKAEALLAQVRWSDAWNSEAMELRINWRNQVPNPKFRKQSGEDAIRLIDRLAIMNPTLGLYALRATAGLTAQRPDVVVESVSNYARLGAALTRAGYGSTDALRRDVRTLAAVLDAVAKMPGTDQARVVEVRAEMTALSQSR